MPKDKRTNRTEILLIRISKSEKRELARASRRAKKKPSAFARDAILPHLTPPPDVSAFRS